MELNVLIENSGAAGDVLLSAGKIASSIGRWSFVAAAEVAPDIRHALNRLLSKPDAIVFTDIHTPQLLTDCVAALKEYRADSAKEVSAVFVCDPGTIVLQSNLSGPQFPGDLSLYAGGIEKLAKFPPILPEEAAALAAVWRETPFFTLDGDATEVTPEMLASLEERNRYASSILDFNPNATTSDWVKNDPKREQKALKNNRTIKRPDYEQ